MLTADLAELRNLEARAAALAEHRLDGSALDALRNSIDRALPPELISTTECAIKHRLMEAAGGGAVKWNPDKTPYMVGIQDACDIPAVRVVAVKGPARSGKTVGAENRALKHWIYGPSVNVLWYMQSREDVDDYVEERVEWMLHAHEQVDAKIQWTNRRTSRNRKRIGGALVQWRPATKSTTRGKAAPLIVADEIDGYTKAIRRSILTRLINRQREFGNGALAYICSHPDEGPTEGIDAVLRDCLQHLWNWLCPGCRRPSSPSPEAEHRMTWNLAEVMEEHKDLERKELLDMVEAHTALVCPYDDCGRKIAEIERMPMCRTGRWLQPHQTMDTEGNVHGDALVAEYMGFTIHGFMSPFVTIGGLAREFAAAKLETDFSGDETGLKEVVVKSLGETYIGSSAAEQIDDYKIVTRRLTDQQYLMGTVPPGCQFLTAFVDVQGDHFAVRVIGWSAGRESWLIDAFPIKQAEGMATIDPFHRLDDWNVLEDAVLRQTYPLAADPRLHLPIARVVVDTGGGDETTVNARKWAANIISRKTNPVPDWRILLTKGGSNKNSELYGIPKKPEKDDRGKALPNAAWERTVNVHELKRIIAVRMKIEVPGPGKMHLPLNVTPRIVRELTAERLVNGDWFKHFRFNETWDAWVACEVARETLQPERPGIDWVNRPPIWAKPFEIGKERGIDNTTRKRPTYYDRLRRLNRRGRAEE